MDWSRWWQGTCTTVFETGVQSRVDHSDLGSFIVGCILDSAFACVVYHFSAKTGGLFVDNVHCRYTFGFPDSGLQVFLS